MYQLVSHTGLLLPLRELGLCNRCRDETSGQWGYRVSVCVCNFHTEAHKVQATKPPSTLAPAETQKIIVTAGGLPVRCSPSVIMRTLQLAMARTLFPRVDREWQGIGAGMRQRQLDSFLLVT